MDEQKCGVPTSGDLTCGPALSAVQRVKSQMMRSSIRRLLSLLPASLGGALSRARYGWQIRTGRFVSPEPEFGVVRNLLREGDWVIDIGANVGHYTKAFSDAVGRTGRVLAFEPIPRTFEFLTTNCQHFRNRNITLFNAAASDREALVSMEIPVDAGGANYYQARISAESAGSVPVLCIRVDSLGISERIALVKIDAEGHEAMVLLGMEALLRRDRPVVILEGGAREAEGLMRELGYRSTASPGSPNRVYSLARASV